MTGAYRIAACAGAAWLLFTAGGCGSTTIPAEEFIARYTTNIQVPNPDDHRLPVRTFQGLKGKDFVIQDIIPCAQGGGFLGKSVLWRCPKAALPADFPASCRPGDLLVDGRGGAQHRYLIQSYMPPARAVKDVAAPVASATTQPTDSKDTAAKDD